MSLKNRSKDEKFYIISIFVPFYGGLAAYKKNYMNEFELYSYFFVMVVFLANIFLNEDGFDSFLGMFMIISIHFAFPFILIGNAERRKKMSKVFFTESFIFLLGFSYLFNWIIGPDTVFGFPVVAGVGLLVFFLASVIGKYQRKYLGYKERFSFDLTFFGNALVVFYVLVLCGVPSVLYLFGPELNGFFIK